MLRPTPGDPWGVEQHHWRNINIPKLNGDEASNLEGMLTLKEAGQTLKKYEKKIRVRVQVVFRQISLKPFRNS